MISADDGAFAPLMAATVLVDGLCLWFTTIEFVSFRPVCLLFEVWPVGFL